MHLVIRTVFCCPDNFFLFQNSNSGLDLANIQRMKKKTQKTGIIKLKIFFRMVYLLCFQYIVMNYHLAQCMASIHTTQSEHTIFF